MKTILAIVFIAFITSLYSQNNPPVAVVDSLEVISQVPTIIDILQNDYDPDGDDFFLFDWYGVSHGQVDTTGGVITYLSEHFTGWDKFKYKIQDDGTPPEQSEYEWVRINVLENTDVPIAVNDTFEVPVLATVQLDILANDIDPNGDDLKILDISNLHGCEASISQDSLTITVRTDYEWLSNSLRYRNVEAFTLEQYVSGEARVYLIRVENPDMPVAVNDETETTGGVPVIIPVMDNDYDPQGEEIELMDYTQPKHGNAVSNGEIIQYLPEVSFSGKDSLTYRIREVNDTLIYSYPAKVYIYVNKNPDCPVGVPDYANGTTYVEMTLDVLPNDYDINGDPFELWDTKISNSWVITEIVDDKIMYTSSPLSLGMDSIFYRIRQTNDPGYYSDWTPVYIDLAVNPELPVAVDDHYETYSGGALVISPLENDQNNGVDTLNLWMLFGYKKGQVFDRTDSGFTYIPYTAAKGVDSIDYWIREGEEYLPLAQGRIYIDITDQHFYDSLAINNINAGFNANGTMFSKMEEIPAGNGKEYIEQHFKYPNGENKSTIFTSQMWIGGMDDDDSLHLAAQRYKQVGKDYRTGPISSTYDEEHFKKYGRTWKISKEEVDHHRNNYWKEDYEPIEPIANWPGNGIPEREEALRLAPFYDENMDGYYDPMDGDYPLIRGDQTLFFIYNDDLDHTETQGERMMVEAHAMVYGYDQPDDTALYNTVFIHYDLYNRSDDEYHDTYVGFFTDFDLGYPWDDFVGSDVERGSFYAYNGKDIDGYGEPGSYGENPPAQSLTVLAGPFIDPDDEDNPDGGCDGSVNGLNFGNGIVDDERHGLTTFMYFNSGGNYNMSDPVIAEEYYTFLQGLWKNGGPIMYGANGHEVTGSVGPACKYMFPGDSDPLNWGTYCILPNDGYNQDGKYWTEEETGNLPYDRRGLGSMGPFTFAPGDIQEIDLAFVVGRGEDGPLSSVEQMKQQIDSLITGVHNGEIIVPNEYLAVDEHKNESPVLTIYPSPARDIIHIKLNARIHPGDIYRIYNMQGNLVGSGQLRVMGNEIIGIGNYPPGLYLVVVHVNQGATVGRFMKF